MSGASNAKLRGSIRKLEARLSGASKAEAVQVEKAEIDVSGASKLKLEVSDKLEGDLSGGSSLKFRGEVDTSGIRISGQFPAQKLELNFPASEKRGILFYLITKMI